MKARTVPIMIDDRKRIPEVQVTRAAYFYVESVEPSENIRLGETDLARSVLPLEFSGVICQPLGGEGLFDSARKIEELFLSVEEHGTLYVDSDNIWIPNEMFDKPPKRADVYRVPFPLFARLYTLCRDDATLSSGIQDIPGASGLITYSGMESFGFQDWTRGVVEDAKTVYPKNSKLALTWRD